MRKRLGYPIEDDRASFQQPIEDEFLQRMRLQRIEKEGLIDEYGLQSWFIGRINHFLQENGKSLIGWDETLEGGLNPGTLVMSWRVSESTTQMCLSILNKSPSM